MCRGRQGPVWLPHSPSQRSSEMRWCTLRRLFCSRSALRSASSSLENESFKVKRSLYSNQVNTAVTRSSWDADGLGSPLEGVSRDVSALCHTSRDLVLELCCRESGDPKPGESLPTQRGGNQVILIPYLGQRHVKESNPRAPEHLLLFVQSREFG